MDRNGLTVHNPSMCVGVRNQRDHSLAQGLSQLLVVNEEEQLVLLDRSAEAGAKLVLPERGLDAVEKVASVESAVAQKLIRRPMQVVGARSAHGMHHGPIAAELGAVSVRENRELSDSLNTQRCAHDAGPGTMVPEALNIGVVQKIGLAFSSRAGDAEVGLDAVQEIRDAGSGVSDLGSSRHAGDQSNQIREVAPVQGQVVDLLLLDVRRHSRR